MSFTDVICDFETLSNDSMECVAVSVAAYKFNLDDGDISSFKEIFDQSYYAKFIAKEQKKLGWVVSADTVEWWKSKGAEAVKNIIPSDDDITLQEFTDGFNDYLSDVKLKRFWVRGSDFDPIILRRIYKQCGFTKNEFDDIIKFWCVRDIRSYIEGALGPTVKTNFIPDNFKEEDGSFSALHDPRYDIALDVKRLMFINAA